MSGVIGSRAVSGATAGSRIPPTWLERGLDAGAYFLELAVILVPLFVLASFLVGLVQQYVPPSRIERLLHRYDGASGKAVAAGLGAVTPFCSCSTIPVLAGLLQAGAPLGLAFSFLLASPIVNWIAILLLLGLFGPVVTASYVLTALTLAVLAGLVLGRFDLESHVKDVELEVGLGPTTAGASAGRRSPGRGAVGGSPDPMDSSDGGCTTERSGGCLTDGPTRCATDGPASTPAPSTASNPPVPNGGVETGATQSREATRVTHADRVRAAGEAAIGFVREMAPYLLAGMVVAALIEGFVPGELLLGVLGPSNPFAVPIAALAGAPVYVSIEAMLPIADSLARQGVPIGTVLAFVVGGAGVSIPNLIILGKLFDRYLLAVYAGIVVAVGVSMGLSFNLLLV